MAEFEIGAVIDGHYEILGVLGSGGMGCVYRARQLNLDRTVAIKVPTERIQANAEFMARFLREAHLCAQISHPNVVAIYDVRSEPVPCIVLEYVDGMPLNRFLSEESTTIFVSDLLDIIGQICQGLDAAHLRGIVHRDIKPANIVITSDSHQVKIMDFGIARAAESAARTMEGAVLGTPHYMAPEQIRGEEASGAADIYGLGGVVYHLFTASRVFEGEIASLLHSHVSSRPDPPTERNAMLPAALDAVLLRALDKKPAKRHGTAMEFHRELRKALRPLAHLPYSQIFPRSRGAVFLNSIGEGYAATLASSETPDHRAQTGDGPDLRDFLDSDALTRAAAPAPTEPPRKSASLRPFLWIASLAVALAIAFWFGTHHARRGADLRVAAAGGEAQLARANGRPAPEPAKAQDTGAEALCSARLAWVGAPPAARYATGSRLALEWMADPRPSAAQPPLYRIELTAKGAEERHLVRRTRYGKFAWPLAKPGDYEIAIRMEDRGSWTAEALRADFSVGPAAQAPDVPDPTASAR